MSNRRIEARRVATNKAGTFLEISVSYDDANNSFMGHDRPRGYYVAVSYLEERDGMRYHLIGRGGRGLLETATRFNQRRLTQLADAAKFPGNAALDQIIQRVLDRNGLTLAEEPAEVEACTVA